MVAEEKDFIYGQVDEIVAKYVEQAAAAGTK